LSIFQRCEKPARCVLPSIKFDINVLCQLIIVVLVYLVANGNANFAAANAVNEALKNYTFPRAKLAQCPPGKDPVVLLACGSFSPITVMHLRMMGAFASRRTVFFFNFLLMGHPLILWS
jgi:hypothetical protein